LAGYALEHREHQGFSGSEVVLDDAPRHSGAAGDLIGAGSIETQLENATDGRVDDALPRREVAIR
jgi:hypothetical protein